MSFKTLRSIIADIRDKLLNGVLNADILSTESSVIDEIDTASDTSPVTVLTPTSGYKIDTRSVYASTDSSQGEVTIAFAGGSLLAKLYCAVHKAVILQEIRKVGTANEAIQISWNGLSNDAKIFYAIRYKETQ